MEINNSKKKKQKTLGLLSIALVIFALAVTVLCDHYYLQHQKKVQQEQEENKQEEEIKEELIFINDRVIPGDKEKCKIEFTAYLQEAHQEVKLVCALENATRITDNHYLFTFQIDTDNKLYDCMYNDSDGHYEFSPRTSEILNIDMLGGVAQGESLLDKYADEAGIDKSFQVIGLSKDAEALISDVDIFKTRLEEWVLVEYPKEKIKKAKFKEIVDVSEDKPNSYCFCFQLDDQDKTDIYVYLGKEDEGILIAKKANVLLLQKEKANKG